MADNNQIKEGEVVGAPIVQSTTEATPSPADETSMPNHQNTETEQPPVRTARPDTPIAQTLAAGAGEHTPADGAVWGQDSRLIQTEDVSTTDAQARNEGAPAERGQAHRGGRSAGGDK
jgi:hypothetical protein